MLKKFFLFLLFLVFIDQSSKKIVLKKSVSYVCNEGIAWGINVPGFLFFVLWLFAVGGLAALFIKTNEPTSRTGVLLIISGAISNLIDRIINGCVIDFIQLFSWFPTFNLADTLITIGAIILIAQSTKLKVKS